MKLKKKIVVTTVAASVAASALAGLPLSDKGLAEKVGIVRVAEASPAPFADATTLSRLTALRAELAKDSTLGTGAVKLAKVREARDLIQAELERQLAAKDLTAVQPLVDLINSKYPGLITTDDQEALLEVVTYTLNLTYDPDGKVLEMLRTNPDVQAFLQKIANPPGATTSIDLKLTDFTAFGLALEAEVKKAAGTKTFAEFALAYATNDSRKELAKTVVKAVLANKTLTFSKIADLYAFDKETLLQVADNVIAKLPAVNTSGSDVVTQAALYVAEAYYNLSLKTDPAPIVSGGGGAVAVTPDTAADSAVKDLAAAAEAIAKATGAEKEKLIAEAVQNAAKAIQALATIDLSKNVTVADGKATLSVSKAQIESLLAEIDKVTKALEAASAGASAKLPKFTLTIDAGDVSTNDTNVALSKDLVDFAASKGVSGFELKISDFSATVPVGGSFTGDIAFGVKNEAATEATTGTLKSASDVYDFSLTVDGKAVTEFDQPILVKIPLKNVAGLDKELLSVAKIVDGKLQFQGGVVDGETIVEPRPTFSSYTVVENKVSFNDTASVQAWAGRQIQVMAAKGAIQGRGQGNFDPKATVTRAEFAAMLVRGLNLDGISTKESFSDVQGTEWFAPYVSAAVEKGIINGRSAELFAPNATITRAEMATMVARALKVTKDATLTEEVDAALKGFSDAAKIQSSLKEGVAFAASKGLIVGNNGKFSPAATATRAEAAVIIYRAFNFAE